MRRDVVQLIVASALALLCLPAVAQTNEADSVTGEGQVVIHPKITTLRFHFLLQHHGDNMDATLKKLEETGQAFRKALLAARADKHSIKLDGPKLADELRLEGVLVPVGPYQQQEPQQQQQQQSQEPYPAPAPQYGPPQQPSQPQQVTGQPARRLPRITVETAITAEWPLKGDTPRALLVEADRIGQAVRAEMANAAKLAAGAQAEASPSPSIEAPEPRGLSRANMPRFLFVGRVSEAQLKKLRAEAFEKAKARATALAEAAGHRLGPLQGLSSYASRFGGSSAYPVTPSTFSATGEQGVADDSDSLEASGSDPSGVDYRVIMNAAFRLQ
jgi:uncharacterized protein YggE